MRRLTVPHGYTDTRPRRYAHTPTRRTRRFSLFPSQNAVESSAADIHEDRTST